MTVIFRPHCGNCGYEFEAINATADEEPPFGPVFEPCYCPKCKEPIKNIIYFVSHRDKKAFDYSKESADNYAKELENHETR